MLTPMSRRWLSRPRTLLLFAVSVATLYLLLIHGTGSRYPAAWSGGHSGQHAVPPSSGGAAGSADDLQDGSEEAWDAEEGEPEGADEGLSEDELSVKNKEDQIKAQFEAEYEELGT